MREIEDDGGIMMKEKGIMKRIGDMIVIEIGLMMREGFEIEGKMMTMETRGEIMKEAERTEGHGGEMMTEGMKKGLILMSEEDNLMREAEVNDKKKDGMKRAEDKTGKVEDLVILRNAGTCR